MSKSAVIVKREGDRLWIVTFKRRVFRIEQSADNSLHSEFFVTEKRKVLATKPTFDSALKIVRILCSKSEG